MMSLPEQFLKLITLQFHDFTCYFTYFATVARPLSRKLNKEKIHIGFFKRPDSTKIHILSHMQATTKGETQHRNWQVSLHPMVAAVQTAMEHTIRQTVSAPTFPLHNSSYLALLHWQLKNLLPNSRERRGNFRHLHLSQQQYMLVWTNVSRKCKKYMVGILTLPVQKITVKLQKLGVGVATWWKDTIHPPVVLPPSQQLLCQYSASALLCFTSEPWVLVSLFLLYNMLQLACFAMIRKSLVLRKGHQKKFISLTARLRDCLFFHEYTLWDQKLSAKLDQIQLGQSVKNKR